MIDRLHGDRIEKRIATFSDLNNGIDRDMLDVALGTRPLIDCRSVCLVAKGRRAATQWRERLVFSKDTKEKQRKDAILDLGPILQRLGEEVQADCR